MYNTPVQGITEYIQDIYKRVWLYLISWPIRKALFRINAIYMKCTVPGRET